MSETVSIYARNMVDALMHLHALANMARGADGRGEEYMRMAARWLPTLERGMESLRCAIAERTAPETATSDENISPPKTPANPEISE